MKEIIVIEAGHFDPVELPVYGEGVYAAVAVSLPRDTSVTPWGQPVIEEPGQVSICLCPKVGVHRKKPGNSNQTCHPGDEGAGNSSTSLFRGEFYSCLSKASPRVSSASVSV